MKTKTLLILWIAFLSFERGNSQSLFMEASPEIEEKVEKLLQQMTLAEKIGQLNQSNANGVATVVFLYQKHFEPEYPPL